MAPAPDLHAKRLIDFTSAAAADIFTACFEGYIVPLRFQAEAVFENRPLLSITDNSHHYQILLSHPPP